ncbi:hypothetical protein COV82_00955 [Candidatus Peregrinibacteria bacterium CG11_big_fil_rev_8_21_14_0_20_46_8]|nr:MAG: hypothetical protein COV82_00955 [Candidatus Peregrinibacteria bacterium CG11_big_fil_rev_8_21_14_0_20_46_8]
MITLILHNGASKIGLLREGLRFENIEVLQYCITSKAAIDDKLYQSNAVIIYLDDDSTHELSFIPRIQTKNPNIPIIVVDHRTKISDRKSIEAMTHSYFRTPISIRIIAITLKRLACTMQVSSNEETIQAHDVWLDLQHRYAKRKEKIIPLRAREFSLLEFFMINHGKVLTRSAILEFVWDHNAQLTSNTVDVHVNRLRRKLDHPFKEKLIHTIPCVGYRFGTK